MNTQLPRFAEDYLNENTFDKGVLTLIRKKIEKRKYYNNTTFELTETANIMRMQLLN